jgi:hypothetical protein
VLLIFIPTTTCSSCLFADFAIPHSSLTFHSFLDIQLYNGLLSAVSIPVFGYFINTKLKPIELTPTTIKTTEITAGINDKKKGEPPPKLQTLNHDEAQARKVLQKLHEAMETEQLYLSHKCNLQLVSEHTGIPIHRISGTINHFSQCTFTDFVNKYRVEHVCRILLRFIDTFSGWFYCTPETNRHVD